MGPCDKSGCCIVGTTFACDDNCGYFDANPGTRELPDEQGRTLIGQFSLPDGAQNDPDLWKYLRLHVNNSSTSMEQKRNAADRFIELYKDFNSPVNFCPVI